MEFLGLNILEYGVFDSRAKFPKIIKTQTRNVEVFEVELFTEDNPGVCYIDEEEYSLKKGTLICAKPGQRRSSRLHFKCLYLHLSTEDPVVLQTLNELPSCSVRHDADRLTEMFQRLMRLDVEKYPEEQLLMHGLILEFLYRLRQGVSLDKQEYNYRHELRYVESYIRSNLAENMDLEHLSARANLSPSYFHKLFCAYFGMTPSEYVLECRIAEAKTMLAAGELTMGQIAVQCGFASQSYFNFRFKQIVGQTPLQYRRACLSRLSI